MFIPLNMVLIGIDPYPYIYTHYIELVEFIDQLIIRDWAPHAPPALRSLGIQL